MEPTRIAVKLDLADPGALAPEELIPVFHSWIRRGAVDGLLIDVAGYAHVDRGPGVLLIGHEADHSLDLAGGRPGLLYTRKRGGPGPFADRLRDAVSALLAAAAVLEDEPGLEGRARLRTDGLTVRVLDRLAAPNSDETLDALAADLADLAAALWPDADATVTRVEDGRGPFTVRLAATEAPGLEALTARIGGAGVLAG